MRNKILRYESKWSTSYLPHSGLGLGVSQKGLLDFRFMELLRTKENV